MKIFINKWYYSLNATFLYLYLYEYYIYYSTSCFGLTRPSSGVGTLTTIVALSLYYIACETLCYFNKTLTINNQCAQLAISRLPGFLWTLKGLLKILYNYIQKINNNARGYWNTTLRNEKIECADIVTLDTIILKLSLSPLKKGHPKFQ
jgi:hypothetical protein